MKLSIFALCFLLVIGYASADNDSMQEEHRYIAEKIAAYGEAVERCEKMTANRALPPESVMDKLRGYEIEDVRAFLITRNTYLEEECQKPALTELAYAIGVLEGANVSGKPKMILENIKPLVFGKETWGLKERYMQLPDNMRQTLEKEAYFDQPYNDFEILQALESGSQP